MPKLLTIDGLSIVRRVYEASPDPDSPDKAAQALRHAFSSLQRLLDTHQASHVLAAFDFGGPTWRHELYPRYREKRQAMPADLRNALPALYQSLSNIGVKVVSIPLVEADDVIATAVLRWFGEGRGDAIIASTDKDLHPLIAQGARIWDHFKTEWHDRDWVIKKFGVPPEQLTDLLALAGDAVDGVPGVSNVGLKKAAKLLTTYGNLDGVMAGAGILITTLGATLRKEQLQLRLSRQLVGLKTDVQLGVTWSALRYIDTAAPTPASFNGVRL